MQNMLKLFKSALILVLDVFIQLFLNFFYFSLKSDFCDILSLFRIFVLILRILLVWNWNLNSDFSRSRNFYSIYKKKLPYIKNMEI